MGLPSMEIPESLVQELAEILRHEGLVVTMGELSSADKDRGFMLLLICSSEKGGIVQLTVQKASNVPKAKLVGILEPKSNNLRNLFKDDSLMKQMEDILLKRGATGRRQRRTEN